MNNQQNSNHSSYPPRLLARIKYRARKIGVPFDLTVESLAAIPRPEYCPVLNIKMDYFTNDVRQDSSASLDRINNELGYVSTNVRYVSWRANLLKSNATADELRLVLADLESTQ